VGKFNIWGGGGGFPWESQDPMEETVAGNKSNVSCICANNNRKRNLKKNNNRWKKSKFARLKGAGEKKGKTDKEGGKGTKGFKTPTGGRAMCRRPDSTQKKWLADCKR